MLGALKALGALFSLLGDALRGLFTLIVYRQGEKAQQAKDKDATLSALEREQEAAAKPTDTSKALGDGTF